MNVFRLADVPIAIRMSITPPFPYLCSVAGSLDDLRYRPAFYFEFQYNKSASNQSVLGSPGNKCKADLSRLTNLGAERETIKLRFEIFNHR